MVDSKFFGIPFAVSGDKAAIPEDTQPSGAISYQQGYGPDYERDPATDPLAKRVPRDETNELYFQITNSLRWLQLYGMPEWYAVDDNGDPVNYPANAWVRRTVSGTTIVYVSLADNNTTTPGTDPTKWVAFSPAVVQSGTFNFTTAAGSGNALTAALSPTPPALVAGLPVFLVLSATNTGAVTLNLNGLGVKSVLRSDGQALAAGDAPSGMVLPLQYDGTAWRAAVPLASQIRAAAFQPQTITKQQTPGAFTFIVPAGVYSIFVRLWGAGGGGGYSSGGGAASGGSAGAYAERRFLVSPGDAITGVVGVGGQGGAASPAQPGQPGGNTTITVGGVTVTAQGGPGGINASVANTVANSPAGASYSNADFGVDGGRGFYGVISAGPIVLAGNGGASPNGGNVSMGGTGSASNGAVPGGGASASGGAAFAGGTGARGEVHFVY